jgi:hypothetical protein
MGKFLSPERSNPDLFGEDLTPLAFEALGVGLAAFGNDKIVKPIVSQVMPGSMNSGMAGKLVDAGTTGLTGWAINEGVGMANKPIGNRIRRGGVLLAVAKVISAVVPGFSLSATLPSGLTNMVPAVSSGASSDAKALPAGSTTNAAAVQTATPAQIGVGKMGI